jgi:ribosomal-protein-serine acetyltransferase
MTDTEIKYLVVPVAPTDAQAYLAAVAASIAELSDETTWAGANYSPQQSVEWVNSRAPMWAAGREYSFCIKEPETLRLLGVCTLNRIDWLHGCGNLSFWTETSAAKQGVATTGARAVSEFGFTQLKLARIEVLTARDNKGAQKVARNIGAKREGALASRLLINGTRRDAALYAVIAEGG